MTARRVLCLASCAVDAVYEELCERLKLGENDCRDKVDAVCKYYWDKSATNCKKQSEKRILGKILVLSSSI